MDFLGSSRVEEWKPYLWGALEVLGAQRSSFVFSGLMAFVNGSGIRGWSDLNRLFKRERRAEMSAETGIVLLFFSGVIAFVPQFPEPNVVNAFLINIDEPEHIQRLRVPLDSLQDRKCPYTSYLSGYCKEDKDKNFCDCDLRKSVTVSIPNEIPSTKELPDRPPGKLPDEKKDNAGDIGWLVNMWYIKPSAASFEKENIPDHVGGQIAFNWVDAATCLFEEALCKVNGEMKRRIYAVNFDAAIINQKQAVPELVVFKSTNKSKDVMIKLERREKKQVTPIATLNLICPSEDSCPVLITNVMDSSEDDSGKLCKECGESKKEGAHFREYRRLTNDPFGVASHRLCKAKHYTELPNELPELCKPLGSLPPGGVPRAVSNRIICPAAILAPD